MPRKSSKTSSGSSETIAAVASPGGPGLRAIVRLSGPRAVAIGGDLPGAIVFSAPRTYTCEDLVEIHLPGSPPLVDRLVRDLLSKGARPAQPGEFTLRAFLNGRLDLAQAEAVEHLIASEDDEERRAALEQLQGEFSRRLRRVESSVLDLCADAEAAIDFVDQDIEILSVSDAVSRAARALEDLRVLGRETSMRSVVDGRAVVALYGRPNAGKSTLFNALTGGHAIVTPVAGTTRDILAADLDIGVPVRLLDTAGDRDSEGLERDAVRRGRDAAASADVVLFVVDVAEWEASLPLEPHGRPAILVLNKGDLEAADEAQPRFRLRQAVRVSARTGQGLPELKTRLAAMLGKGASEGAGARFRLNARQHALLSEAEGALERAAEVARGLGMEFLALDLRAALESLGGITGRHVSEDLLDRIFSRFCLGK